MKKFFNFFFSMQFSGFLLLLFAVVIGTATFIENDLGTRAAKLIVYEAKWFEFLLFVLAISMLGRLLKRDIYNFKKYNVLLFHLSFLVILLGAAITRYTAYEGNMHIREQSSSNQIISDESYLQIDVKYQGQSYLFEEKKIFSPYKKNRFDKKFNFGDQDFRISFVNFITNPAEQIVEDTNGYPIISIVCIGENKRDIYFLKKGESIFIGNQFFSFEDKIDQNSVQVKYEDDQLQIQSPKSFRLHNMRENTSVELEANVFHSFQVMKMYQFGTDQIVIRSFFPKAITKLISAEVKDPKAYTQDAIILNVEYQGKNEEFVLYTDHQSLLKSVKKEINGTLFNINYGPKLINIPFTLYLRDFQLDRYPGSMSPSSYASEITLIDERTNLKKDHRIFMNNILNYNGYRFFQSSYDRDEKGTILSVNHDYWGTFVTYLGYLLMTLGMILSFFNKNSRFRNLIRSMSKHATTTILITGISLIGFLNHGKLQAQNFKSQNTTPSFKTINSDDSKAFGSLLVQDHQGRIKPINTLSSEILRKVTRKNKFMYMNADQIFLGMLSNPMVWQNIPMIKVSSEELKNIINIKGNYASFSSFFDYQNRGRYKLVDYANQAHNKKPAMRSAFDKDIIKVDERVNICYTIYTGGFLKIFPLKDDPNQSWYSTQSSNKFDSTDIGFVSNILPMYFEAVNNGNQNDIKQYLESIKDFQQKFGSQVAPSKTKVKLEILYNKINIFKRLFPFYGSFGFIILILVFISLINPKYQFKKLIRIGMIHISGGFVFHTLGMATRWYISGHAPWSNGYETMIYIAWATVLAGFFFFKKSKITMAITTILASLTLMVANLNWMDPEITNLLPVLKSFWLVIHVAVITASYSFLAIGALLGFFNLILMILKKSKNITRLQKTIKELTNINEINLMIGLVLLTIGSFLGAVWANESWGRYWGWDPKETWALITIVIYAFVSHMHLIPGLKSTFAFNFATLISFSSVLMTYFGVNYYLSGMHSYASGDPVPVPNFVYYTIVILTIVSIMAYLNERKTEKIKIKSKK